MKYLAPDYKDALFCPSPNFGVRASNKKINAIILHYTGMETGKAAQDWLCNPLSQVSSHYLIYENGAIIQMVAEKHRAWHAGKSYWHFERDMNSVSIGIELVNKGHSLGYTHFLDTQISALITLCHDIMQRHQIPSNMVLAHSDIAPMRKIDPGELFPWEELARQGVGHYAPPHPIEEGEVLQMGDVGIAVAGLQSLLYKFGFESEETGVFDEMTYKNVSAFQRHYRREKIDGCADSSTVKTLLNML